MKKIIFIIGAFLTILALFSAISNKYKTTAEINNHKFKVYVAKTAKDKQIGLSKYNKLPQDYGMIFLFDKESFYSFWMKDMKFPIDIIFIKNNIITTIYANVPAPKNPNDSLPSYQPKVPSNMVLEINAGLSKKYAFKEGDKIAIKNL